MTTREAGELLGVSDSRVRQFIRAGRLAVDKHGSAHAIKRKDVDALARKLAEDAPRKRGPRPNVLKRPPQDEQA